MTKTKEPLTYISVSSVSSVSRDADMITPLSVDPVDFIDCTDK